MRMLTKAEACRELAVSLSTLDRRIASGEIPARREPRGRRHRVYVMLEDDPPGNGKLADSELAAARERIRGLEEQVDLLCEQLEQERQRNAGLVDELKAAQTTARGRRGLWWRFWRRWMVPV
ncbi:MAG: hypothetical protein F4X66_11930 [Chloroflexi bacterium]|nr:hypothetical protein [Chloroflexota bacterium]